MINLKIFCNNFQDVLNTFFPCLFIIMSYQKKLSVRLLRKKLHLDLIQQYEEGHPACTFCGMFMACMCIAPVVLVNLLSGCSDQLYSSCETHEHTTKRNCI